MYRPRKRFVMLVVPVALILSGSFLLAQQPPKQCAKTCQQIYADAVKSCHGDQACLAGACRVGGLIRHADLVGFLTCRRTPPNICRNATSPVLDWPDHFALPHSRTARRGRNGCGLQG